MGTVERYHEGLQGAEGDHQGDGPRADAADVGQEEEGEEGDEEAGEEEGEEAEEEEKEEEEGRQVPGRQAAEGRPQEQGHEGFRQEDRGDDEEEGHWALRHQDALRRPRRDLRQEQDAPHGGDEGDLGVHQEEQAQQGPHHHAGREAEEGPAVRLVQHVQDAGDAVEAHQVSARSRARSIAKPCSTLTQHMYRTAAAWRNLMTCRRCRVYWSMPFSTRGRETSSPTCGRIWRSLVEG